MKNRIQCFLFALFVLFILAAAAIPSKSLQLEELLKKGLQRGYPGIGVLVENRKGEIHAAAVGYSDLENQALLRVEDAFHMGSINKAFTAVTLRLIESGGYNDLYV
ncbi:beta-lactamase family protein, partial [bacterium]|nr:beta-lactamase family protein [bacterium]